MAITYSTHNAKARFSEVIRRVRDGQTVTISYRGEPVAEIRPIKKKDQTIENGLDDLEERGELIRSSETWRPVAAGGPRPGSVARFLADRNR